MAEYEKKFASFSLNMAAILYGMEKGITIYGIVLYREKLPG
jgi:hypothetical protein